MRDQLEKELRAAGAGAAEASELAGLAAQLPQLRGYRHGSLREGVRNQRVLKLISGSLAGLAAGALLVLVSQPVLPTSWLYPVQKFSDNVAVEVHPQYRANIMMKRAQQVNALVAGHASSSKVFAVLADYANQARAYKTMPHANYAAFEFCKTNLQQAEASASPSVKQAIQNSLQALETT